MVRWCFAALLLIAAMPVRSQEPDRPVSISDLVHEALAQNPELRSHARRIDAMRARIPQAGALPDPLWMSGVINEGRAAPFDTLGTADFSEVYVGFSQDVPFPGKRRLREEVARRGAAAGALEYELLRRRLAVDVTERYYELQGLRASRQSVARNVQVLEHLVGVTRERFAVGQAIQQDVFAAEAELSRLEERRLLLEQQEALVLLALGRLLHRQEPMVLGPLAPLEATPLGGTLEELLAEAQESSPLLAEQRERVQAAARQLELARRDLLPDLGFEVIYHNRGSKDLDPFYTVGWTLTLPIYAGRKQRKAIDEAAAELTAARSRASAARAQVREDVTQAYVRATTADRVLRVYDEGLLAQGRLALDSAVAQYQVGKVDFIVVTTSWTRLLEDEIRRAEQLATREAAATRLALHLGRSSWLPADTGAEN